MFNFFKKKSTKAKVTVSPFDAKAAKNLAVLSNQLQILKATESSGEVLSRAFAAIKQQAS